MTNDPVDAWYGRLLKRNPEELNNRSSEIMKKVTHVPDVPDPFGAVVDYVGEVFTKIRQMGI